MISGFGPFGQPGQYIKKNWGTDYEQLLRAFFSCFGGQHYSVRTKKLHNKSIFLFVCFYFFGMKLFFRAAYILKCECTT